MIIEARVADYIRENGIKQTFVSEKTGIDPSCLSKMLNGNRKMKAHEYEAICKALNKEPNDFMEV